MWVPRFDGAFELRDDIWRCLTPERAAQLEQFVRQYRVVREHDGYRAPEAEYYRRLPTVAAGDPQARSWQVRRETYHHLLGHVLAAGPLPLHILDLGAGSGWLSHRLASLGHRAVAVDAVDDSVDGLGAARHYVTKFALVQADFDALPFAPGQFDLVVFNGSLHYAADTSATLEHAHRMLASGGALVVMDSPMFLADRDGSAMVVDMLRRFTDDCGLTDAEPHGVGYLTFTMLTGIAERLRLRPQFVPSRGPLGWRLRRQLARVRLGRSPAAFGLWVAR
jgi:SAM-dependent methyltransferase